MAGLAFEANWSALTLVIIQTAFVLSAGYELFPPDNITNPVEFVNFGTGSVAREQGEAEIGRILNSQKVHAIFLACSLEWKGIKYLPIPSKCSDSDASSVEDMEDGTANLYFVYGRPGGFTKTFLRLPAPNRYFSLTFLGGRVVYLRKDLIFNLRIRSDEASRHIWLRSSTDLRKSFIHRKVNQTLTEAQKRGDFSSKWLNGSIYVRSNPIRNNNESEGLEYPLFFGKVHRYEECDRSLFPLDVSQRNKYIDGYSFTVCNNWEYFDRERAVKVKFWLATVWFQWIFLSVLCIGGYWYCRVVFQGFSSKYSTIPTIGRRAMRPGEFPETLTVSCLFLEMSPDHVARRLAILIFCSHILVVCLLPCVYFALLIKVPYKLYNQLYLLEGNGISRGHEACWKPAEFDPYKAFIVCAVFTYAYWLLYGIEMYLRNTASRNTSLVYVVTAQILGWINRLLLLIYVVINTLFIVNIVPIAIFTVVGLSITYPNISLLALTLIKIIPFDIFRLTQINATVSKENIECKAALDAAIKDLAAKASCTPSVNQEDFDMVQDYYASLIKHEETVLLLLCKQYILDHEDGSLEIRLPDVRNAASEDNQRCIKRKLWKRVRWAGVKYLSLATTISFIAMAILGTLQILLVHVQEVAGIDFPAGIIIPAVTAVATFMSAFSGGDTKNGAHPHQIASAKTYFLMLNPLPTLSTAGSSRCGVGNDSNSIPSPGPIQRQRSYIPRVDASNGMELQNLSLVVEAESQLHEV